MSLEEVNNRTLQAMLEAQERWNECSEEIKAVVRAMHEGIEDLLSRTFVSPDNGHGRQTFYIATHEELAEWKLKNDSLGNTPDDCS